MDGWVGECMNECEVRTIYIDHLQLVENEQNKREKMYVRTLYIESNVGRLGGGGGGWLAATKLGK